MKTQRRFFIDLGLLVILAMLLASCKPVAPAATQPPAEAAAPQSAPTSGELLVGVAAGSIDHLDPHLAYFATSWRIVWMACTPLLTLPDADGDAGKQVIPGLAELPTISEDGKSYTFKLRPEIKFADGTPITGEDVKATYERVFTPSLASPVTGFFTDIIGSAEFASGAAKEISGITVSGSEVTFQLAQPSASFLKRVTMPLVCIVPKGSSAEPQEDGQLLVTGAYKVESYEPNRELVLVRNPNYALEKRGNFDKIVIKVGVDPAQAGLMIRANQLDLYLDALAPADAAQAMKDDTLKGRIFSQQEPTTVYLWMNNDVPPFDNVKVRQAVNYAIDRETLLRVWGGPSQGQTTDQILPFAMEGWKDVENYPSKGNLEKSKALLAESGVTLPIETTLRTINDVPGYVELAQAIQSQLKEVGINITIESSPNSVNEPIITTRANNVPMGIVSWTIDYSDPDNVIGTLLDGTRITDTNNQNKASFNSDEINQMIAEMANVTGPDRATGWHQIDEKIMKDYAPWAPLVYPVRVDILSERVKVPGWIFHPVRGEDIAVVKPAQ